MRARTLGRLLPHLPDTERAQKAGKILLLALFDLVYEVFRGLFSHAVERRNGLCVEPVEICRGFHHTAVHQRLGKREAEPFNVHCLAGSEMDEIAEPLRRTFHTRTAHRCAVRVALHRRAALRTGIRQVERYGSLRAAS